MFDEDDVPQLIDTSEHLRDLVDENEYAKTVPITIVTGYLGSGKSTMLKYITSHNAGKKIAIILNEFGDTADIERALTVADGETEVEEWLELENGCLCCTAKDAGVTAIENLMKRKGRFDYILLETTGIADPAPIASMFWLDDALASSLILDGVVTVVDAEHIIRSLAEGDTAKVQLATADIVVLNKTDKVSDEQLSDIRARIGAINSASQILETNYGVVDPEQIMGLHAYQEVDIDYVKDSFAPSAKHDTDITTIALELHLSGPQDVVKLESRLQHLLWEHDLEGSKIEIHRSKGRFVTPEAIQILQGVRETYEIRAIPELTQSPQGDKPAHSKLVLIGRGLAAAREKIRSFLLE